MFAVAGAPGAPPRQPPPAVCVRGRALSRSETGDEVGPEAEPLVHELCGSVGGLLRLFLCDVTVH